MTVLGEPLTEGLVVRDARDLARPTLGKSTLKAARLGHARPPFWLQSLLYEPVNGTPYLPISRLVVPYAHGRWSAALAPGNLGGWQKPKAPCASAGMPPHGATVLVR